MAFDVLEVPVEREAARAARKAGPILRVGIPTTGGRILKAARDAGYSVLFSTNAFMNRDGYGEVVSVRRPDPEQFAGLDAALDSAGFVAMARYRGFPWTIEQYLDLVGSWPWAWYASWDQCVEPEIASSKIDVYFRLAETCRLLSEVRMRVRDRGLADPMPVVQGWEVDHYRWSLDHLPLAVWPKLLGVGSMCLRHVHGPNGILAIVEALDRVLPCGVGLPLFGVKGTALRLLSDHPRIASVDPMAWDFAARRDRGRWVNATAMRRGRAIRPGAGPRTSGRTGRDARWRGEGLNLLRWGRTTDGTVGFSLHSSISWPSSRRTRASGRPAV